jgi:hypothetical protein
MARHITIDQIVTESLQGLARLNALVDGLSDAQMLWRPSPSSWSIAECLDHLNRTLALYTGQLRIAFERERQNAPLAPSSFRVGFIASKMAILGPSLPASYEGRGQDPARSQTGARKRGAGIYSAAGSPAGVRQGSGTCRYVLYPDFLPHSASAQVFNYRISGCDTGARSQASLAKRKRSFSPEFPEVLGRRYSWRG